MEEKIQGAMERLRRGEIISGHCWVDHGVQEPFIMYSSLRYQDGAFIYKTWIEEGVTPIVEHNVKEITLNETQTREHLQHDSNLRGSLT